MLAGSEGVVSAMSNPAEGFSRRSNKEFVQLLFISKSSTTEVQSEAYVALDQKYISQNIFQEIYDQAETKQNYNGYGPYFHHLFVFQYPIRTGCESKLGRGIANK